MMSRVLITDAVHPDMITLFQNAGVEVNYQPDFNQEQTLSIIQDYDLLVINSKIQVDASFMDQASNLKIVGRLGSGKEIIDMEYATKKNIQFHNSPEGNRDAVAEHALGLLLGLLNNIPKSFEQVKNGKWIREANRGHELKYHTVALLGYGNTGKAFANLLQVFGCKILAYDKFLQGFSSPHVEETDMLQIFQEATIVSLHLPLTSLTNHLINDEFIAAFQNNFYLLNTSRGKIVDETALLNALKSSKIKGFASDVLNNEKLDTYTKDETLRLNDILQYNTIITPHIAGWTYESKKKLAHILANKMIMSLTNH